MLSIPGRFAFRGAGGEPPQRQSACGVSPVPLIPQESARLPFQSTECTKSKQLYKTIKVRKRSSKHHPLQSACVRESSGSSNGAWVEQDEESLKMVEAGDAYFCGHGS
ncbi:hypothetical protein [Pseudobacillus badius]|uniref:hypothetical protein n=1 Tax=Bacillus badius TaxID=1455 RepID=UPI001CBAD4C9|nr:hypothetical protein [Bacillus badius]UAT30085.1 hypothetical protein K7T73_16245 [Bacillus badius]